MTRATTLAALVVAAAFAPASALAWDPFRTRNSAVEEGNARMADGDATGALASYDQAARQLPNEPRVQLNRGLALMAADQLPEAREAFLRAADPDAPAEVRADAYYDLGLAFFQEGDAAATEEDHQNAQASFREAADAFRRSLRARPGNRDAAWNLELALRRIREEEEKQEQEEQQQEQQQNQDQQQEPEECDPSQEDCENENQGDQNQDQQQDQGEQNDQQQDQGEQNDQQQDQGEDGQDQQDEGEEGQDSQEGDGQEPEEQEPEEQESEQGNDGNEGNDSNEGEEQEGQPEQQGGQEPEEGEDREGGQRLPNHVERVLDALEDDEESLQRARARARAARDNRRVTMDW